MVELNIKETRAFDYGMQDFIDIIADGVSVGRMNVLHYESGETHVDRIDIEENYQNHGFGTAALEQFSGAYIVADNADAARLYERLGREVNPSSDWAYLDEGFGVYQLD